MPRPDLLETFPNPYPGRDYEIYMECAEFTSLCPVGGIETDAAELEKLRGGAPDFGTIRITYVPDELCLELKALKLYLWSFRDDGIFYERAVNRILDDLSSTCSPTWMEVVGDFNVRGGIKSVVTARVMREAGDAGRIAASTSSKRARVAKPSKPAKSAKSAKSGNAKRGRR